MPGKSKKLAGPVQPAPAGDKIGGYTGSKSAEDMAPPTHILRTRDDVERWDKLQATNEGQAAKIGEMLEYITERELLQDFVQWRAFKRDEPQTPTTGEGSPVPEGKIVGQHPSGAYILDVD